MVRNWGDVREVLEDIERDRLEEKLKKLDDNLTIASQLPTTDPEAVAAMRQRTGTTSICSC